MCQAYARVVQVWHSFLSPTTQEPGCEGRSLQRVGRPRRLLIQSCRAWCAIISFNIVKLLEVSTTIPMYNQLNARHGSERSYFLAQFAVVFEVGAFCHSNRLVLAQDTTAFESPDKISNQPYCCPGGIHYFFTVHTQRLSFNKQGCLSPATNASDSAQESPQPSASPVALSSS